jgi:hypothetical protein
MTRRARTETAPLSVSFDQTEVAQRAILEFLNAQAGIAGSDAGPEKETEKEKVSC